jgi:hypothetical protein
MNQLQIHFVVMFEGYQFWQPSREEDHPTKSQFPKFGAEN